jgi:hypothetical protein
MSKGSLGERLEKTLLIHMRPCRRMRQTSTLQTLQPVLPEIARSLSMARGKDVGPESRVPD